MNIKILNSEDENVILSVGKEKLIFIYSIVYASIQFVDDVDFASLTGKYKEDGRKLLDELQKLLDELES